jgi:hypothetical protein
MENRPVPVRNAFTLREGLEVALEVTWPDLGPEQGEALRALTRNLPVQVAAVEVTFRPQDEEAFLACMGRFKGSRTWYWLRSDLSEALTEAEQHLNSKRPGR